jgi:hypothetical protein
MKKMTTYLKYMFGKNQPDALDSDVQYLLPLSKKIFKMFEGNNAQESSAAFQLPKIFSRSPTVSTVSPTL